METKEFETMVVEVDKLIRELVVSINKNLDTANLDEIKALAELIKARAELNR